MKKRAIILAGGKGTRLRPYTVVFPKPLMPIGEYPILEVVIRQLARQGFGHITMAVNHQAELIKAFFGDGSRWNIRIDYSLEEKPLSTMGPIRLIPDLPEEFLIMNGDVLTDLPYGDFLDTHRNSGKIFTIGSARRVHVNDYGVLISNEKNELTGFKEKPTTEFLVSMGVYAASRRVLDHIPPDTFFGFDHLMLKLITAGDLPRIHVHEGYWLDIGRPDDYHQAIEIFEKKSEIFL